MKIVKGNYGECRFCDNMDEKHGLPSLEDKSWDLCLTDPPYNLKWDCKNTDTSQKRINSIIKYSDKKTQEEYMLWSLDWYKRIIEICNRTCHSPGLSNLQFWYGFNYRFGLFIWHNENKQGAAKGSYFSKYEPFLLYNIKRPFCFKKGIIRVDNPNRNEIMYRNMLHPCPKFYKIWDYIIKELKPESIIDPFLGSGTTAEVCESLGIPWLGYELMEEYVPDIEKRIQRGITKKKYATKQQTLF